MNYFKINDKDGKVFLTTSFCHRTRWRNLRGEAPVVVRMHGNVYPAFTEMIEDEIVEFQSFQNY